MRRVLLLCLLLCLPGAAAQGGVRLLDADDHATVRPGAAAELTWLVAAVDGQDHFLLAEASITGQGWAIDVEPRFVNIPAGATQAFTVTVTPDGDPTPRTLPVRLIVTDAASNATLTGTGTVEAVGFGLILGQWENPLGDPLDGAVGTFLINVLAWMAVGLAVMLLVSPSLKILTLRTRTTIDDNIIRIVARPIFVLVFAYGVKQSTESLPLPHWSHRTIAILWMVALVVVLVYAAFRLWNEIVLAIGRRAAARTESTLDDRLLPVLEKLGGLVILVVGFFYLADGFGWNMAWLAAGGAIGGLVIAFAAQDTLSNFFSGVFLLVDQPFREGDDVVLATGEVCTVRKIGLRSTDLYHKANHEVIIVPNSLLAKDRIVNILQPDNLYKVRIDVGVAYGTDIQRVKALLMDIGRSHPLSLDEEGHEPFVRFNAFGASSLDLSLTVWVGDVYARYAVASDLREMVEQRFAEGGIEIPFPQRVVWQGRDEADRPDAPRPRKHLKLHGSIEEATKDMGDDEGETA